MTNAAAQTVLSEQAPLSGSPARRPDSTGWRACG